MACNVGRILHALLWILLNATFIGCQQNAAITASKTSLIEGEPLTLTCIYTGIKNESAILWYNKTVGNFFALKPNSSMSSNCSFFSKGTSFESSRVAYTCDFTNNIYTLAIASIQVEDGGLWFCTFQDPFAGSPTSNIILQVNATTTTSTTTTTKPTTAATTSTVKETIETSASTPSIINTPTGNESGKDSHQLVIIISVSVSIGVLVLVTVIISCFFYCRRRREKDKTKHKAHPATASPGSTSTIEQNELYDANNTSQVDSCLDVNKVTKTN